MLITVFPPVSRSKPAPKQLGEGPGELIAATLEEVAAWLSAAEGRVVTVEEVRRIEFQALRKLRRALLERGFSPENLLLNE